MTITIQAFGRESKELDKVCTFQAATDYRTLAETGRSFSRGGKTFGKEKEEEGSTLYGKLPPEVSESAQKNEKLPELDVFEGSPVKLEIYYCKNGDSQGRRMGVQGYRVERSPAAGEKVYFVLRNQSTQRYGVVLMVNGRNTIFSEEGDPARCHKWVLEPNGEVTIRGFQTKSASQDRAHGFEGLSPEESMRYSLNYGPTPGQFALVVFPEAKSDIKVANYETTTLAISRGTLSPVAGQKPTLSALQAELRKKEEGPPSNARGMIGTGAELEQRVEYHKGFTSAPRPAFAMTLIYWQPSDER
jgi:hypothetical protein